MVKTRTRAVREQHEQHQEKVQPGSRSGSSELDCTRASGECRPIKLAGVDMLDSLQVRVRVRAWYWD